MALERGDAVAGTTATVGAHGLLPYETERRLTIDDQLRRLNRSGAWGATGLPGNDDRRW